MKTSERMLKIIMESVSADKHFLRRLKADIKIFAKEYHNEQLTVKPSSLQLPNDNNETSYMDDLVNFRSFGIEEVSNTNLIEFNKIIIEEIHRRKNK